jgi:hypothetical protein
MTTMEYARVINNNLIYLQDSISNLLVETVKEGRTTVSVDVISKLLMDHLKKLRNEMPTL